MSEVIEFVIDEHGNVQSEGKGFQGPHCKTLVREIEQALGTVTHTEMKPEYRQARPQGHAAKA